MHTTAEGLRLHLTSFVELKSEVRAGMFVQESHSLLRIKPVRPPMQTFRLAREEIKLILQEGVHLQSRVSEGA